VRRCTKCGIYKRLEQFSGNARKADGLDLHCRDCICERIRSKKVRHIAQGRCCDCGGPRGDSRSRRYCQTCLVRNSGTQRSREMRAAVMRAYGGEHPACLCCGEDGAAFLTLDHINNGGRAHRRQKGNQGVPRASPGWLSTRLSHPLLQLQRCSRPLRPMPSTGRRCRTITHSAVGCAYHQRKRVTALHPMPPRVAAAGFLCRQGHALRLAVAMPRMHPRGFHSAPQRSAR
jgi:hypothetical protein